MPLLKNDRIKRIINLLLIILFWFAVWQIVSMIVNQSLFVPSPAETFVSLGGLIGTSNFWLSVVFTLYRVVFGLIVSFVLGIGIAFFAAHSRWLENLLRPVVTAIKSTPVISIIILALIWFSSSFVPVFSCILLCFPIFYTNTLTGIKDVDKNLLELAQVYKIKRKRTILEIILPSLRTNIYSALSLCIGFSWKSVVAAEVLSSPDFSMGFSLFSTKQHLDIPALFAWTIAIIIISIILEKLIKRVLPKEEGAK